jgi:hypothetical protein
MTSTLATPSTGGGVPLDPAATPLVGVNYFDGRALRADDLNADARAHRLYAELAGRAGMPSVVHGLDVTAIGQARLGLSAGSAVDAAGRVIHLPQSFEVEVADLLGTGAAEVPGTAAGFGSCDPAPAVPVTATVIGDTALYVVCIAQRRTLCGESEVLGRACGNGCGATTERPYIQDGALLTLRPLTLISTLPALAGVTDPQTHLRSQVAAAAFADERLAGGSLLSAAGLAGATWQVGAPPAGGGDVVPLAVLAWRGAAIAFLDPWTVRRERMDAAARSAWDGRLERRPWSVFLAQLLQFQAQLATAGSAGTSLLARGLVEAPPAAYLPVAPGIGVRPQVEAILGPGMDLRVCAIDRDQIPHELEQAAHLRRISLLAGLAGVPREPVDVLVPDGVVQPVGPAAAGIGLALDVAAGGDLNRVRPGGELAVRAARDPGALPLTGVARIDPGPGWDLTAVVSGASTGDLGRFVRLLAKAAEPGGSLEAALAALSGLRFGAGSPSTPVVHEVAGQITERAIEHRAKESRARAVQLASTPAEEVAAALLSVWTAADPLTATKPVLFSVGFELTLPRRTTVSVSVRAEGRVQVLRPSGGPFEKEVVLGVTGIVIGSATGVTAPDLPAPIPVEELVLRRGRLDDFEVIVLSAGRWVAVAAWHGSPLEARAAVLHLDREPTASELVEILRDALELPDGRADGTLHATARAVQDPAIADPVDGHHAAAIDGLQILAGLHPDDATFVEREAAKMFPRRAPGLTEVRSTTDWVLFRRRVHRDCEDEPAPEAPPDDVLVWLVRADSDDQAEQIGNLLRGGNGGEVAWRQADRVVYEAGADRLLTTSTTWRQRYTSNDGGALIRFAGYATVLGAGGPPVGAGRAFALAAATAPAGVPDQFFQADLLLNAPPTLLVGGTVASIFLITYGDDG